MSRARGYIQCGHVYCLNNGKVTTEDHQCCGTHDCEEES